LGRQSIRRGALLLLVFRDFSIGFSDREFQRIAMALFDFVLVVPSK